MKPIHIDKVRSQRLQTRFQSLHHILAVVAAKIRVALPGKEAEFGCNHKMMAVGRNELADEFLGRSIRISVSRINKISTSISIQIKHLFADFLGCSPAPIFTKRHCSQRHLRDPQPASA
jgi:hypothetical protein